MSWIELDDQILEHPKFIRAAKIGGSDAIFMWLGLRAYCAQKLSDGFIPSDMVDEVRGPRSATKRAASIAVLAEVRLVESEPNGLRLHDYLDWSRSKEEIETRRRSITERQRRHRSQSEPVTRDNAVTNASVTPLVTPSPPLRSSPLPSPPIHSDPDRSKSGVLASLGARDFIAAFCEEWSAAYQGEKYKVSKQDSGQVATMVKESPGLSLLEWRAACARYVRSQKPFYLDSRHPIRLLCMSLNEFSGDVKPISKLERKTADNREMFLQGQEWAAGK